MATIFPWGVAFRQAPSTFLDEASYSIYAALGETSQIPRWLEFEWNKFMPISRTPLTTDKDMTDVMLRAEFFSNRILKPT